MGEGAPTPSALPPAIGGLVGLLRNNRLDVPCPQVGAVGAGGVRLVTGDRVGPGPRTTDRTADRDPAQDRDELRAVTGLPLGQDEGQRTTQRIGGEMDLAGQAAA